MGGELDTETNISNIGLLLRSSAIYVSTNFRLDRERRCCYEFCAEKLVFLSFRLYLVETKSKNKNVFILIQIEVPFFLRMHAAFVVSGLVPPNFEF